MTVCILLILAGGLSVFFFLRRSLRSASPAAVLLKSLSSLFFVFTALAAGAASGSGHVMTGFVTAGLVCGLLGDIWLGLKWAFPKEDAFFTYAGFAAFGIGHILFTAGLLSRYASAAPAPNLWIPFPLAILLGLGVIALEKPMGLRYGEMKPVAAVYAVLLFMTVTVSGSFAFLEGTAASVLFFIGALLFALSDLVLSGSYFGKGHDRPIDQISNIVLYYSGQFLIAFSLLFL